ncbi:MAG TPA: M23 family metallopeptidase [Thermoanaerobaculia bacterium]|nr:M23 family metallopeptidase [Thermoanaerobaculia bacterium]
MVNFSARCVWVGSFKLLSLTIFLSACATVPFNTTAATTPAPAATQQLSSADDDDFSQLMAQMRSDLSRYNAREAERKPKAAAPQTATKAQRDREFAARAQALFAPLNGIAIRMPVVGIRVRDLDDSWHAPRDGGARQHKGIDIFASKGTEVVAVADGIISFIGDQRLGGHCIWLTTENGASFYYAHLDRWAAGLYEGMEVQSGDLLGYVGNTGNAKYTPSHLHFGVNQNDEMVNPYPILARATPSVHAHAHVELGGGFGTR